MIGDHRHARARERANDQVAPIGTAYLLHFTERYEHAGHYTGWAQDLDARLVSHAAGRSPRQGGARLLQVIRQAGIGFQLVRIWPGVTRARERQLKQQGGASRRCPVCLAEQRTQRTVQQRRDRTAEQVSDGTGQRPMAASTSTWSRRRRPGRNEAVSSGRGQTAPAALGQQRREFLALNPRFARPVNAPLRTQWHRVRGREDVELLTPRVIAARFEENEQLSQHRAATVIRRAVQAHIAARQQRTGQRTAERAGPTGGRRTYALVEPSRRLEHPTRTPRTAPAALSARTARPAGRSTRPARPARKEADRER